MDLSKQQPSGKVEKIKKKGKDWTDDVNDSCVALSILCESAHARMFSSDVGDLSALSSFVSGKTNLLFLLSMRILLLHRQKVFFSVCQNECVFHVKLNRGI